MSSAKDSIDHFVAIPKSAVQKRLQYGFADSNCAATLTINKLTVTWLQALLIKA